MSEQNGVIYAIDQNNDLLWFRHDGRSDGSFRWFDNNARKVGVGWDMKHVFSGDVPAGTGDDGPVNPELGDKTGKGDDGPIREPEKDPPPESGPTQNPDNQTPQEKCFIGNTPVLMADGLTKTIDTIAIDDQVMARDEKTSTTYVGSVTRIFRHHVAETLLLQMEGGEVVETTAAHRFATEKRGFVSAGELRPGDMLSTHNDRGAEVVSIESRSAEVTVYNLSVDRFHTFFVGRARLWVHNIKKSDPPLPEPPEPPGSH